MNADANKRVVALFNSHFERSDIDAILDFLADDVDWWIDGRPDLFPVTGSLFKAQFAAINRDMHAALKGGLKMDVVGVAAEGDLVAAELRAHAVTAEGHVYDNDYHVLYAIQDGRIASAHEYTDLSAVAEAFALPDRPTGEIDATAAYSDSIGREASSIDPTRLTENRRIVADFLGKFALSDVDGILDGMTDDATWWANGRPDRFSGAGTRTKRQMAEV